MYRQCMEKLNVYVKLNECKQIFFLVFKIDWTLRVSLLLKFSSNVPFIFLCMNSPFSCRLYFFFFYFLSKLTIFFSDFCPILGSNQSLFLFFCRPTDPTFRVAWPVKQQINLASPKGINFRGNYISRNWAFSQKLIPHKNFQTLWIHWILGFYPKALGKWKKFGKKTV